MSVRMTLLVQVWGNEEERGDYIDGQNSTQDGDTVVRKER